MSIEESIEDRDIICNQRRRNAELRKELGETKAKLGRAVLTVKALDDYLGFINFGGLLHKMVKSTLKELEND